MALPDEVLDPNDPGDDMQRRLRFQAARAVMLALSLLDDGAETDEVFCEQHEDVLVKKRNSRFIGEQVKTKLDESGPLKAIDEEVTRSIQRFVSLERRHGGHFDGYVLGSNAGFWDEDKTTSSLPHILKLASEASDGKAPKKLTDYLTKLFPKPKAPKKKAASTTAPPGGTAQSGGQLVDLLKEWEASIEAGKVVFKKLQVATLPSMRDMRAALIEMLPKFQEVGDRLYSELGTIADALIAEALKAAALVAHETARDRYLSVFNDPEQILTDEILRGKRLTRDRLLTIIRQALPPQPDLRTSDPISVEELPHGMNTLELKMAAGGLSIGNIGLAKDQKSSTEYLLTKWFHKNGKVSTDQRYQHLRTLVRSECQEAFDKAKAEGGTFGPAMLEDVRSRLRTRHRDEGDALFGCKYEHLLGMAGILTEDCTLWWSEEFQIPQEDLA